jgi:copper resistance protein C
LASRRGRCALLAATLLHVFPTGVRAHAVLVRSEPSVNETVGAGAVSIECRFNSRIDRARSRLTLTLPDRTQAVLPIEPGSPVDALLARADLAPGAYTLRWQVLAVDGHITRGDVPFVVTAPGTAAR